MIEFSRRIDKKFNIWQMIDGQWCIVDVVSDHQEAVQAAHALRQQWRKLRDEREAELKVAAHSKPGSGDEGVRGSVQVGG